MRPVVDDRLSCMAMFRNLVLILLGILLIIAVFVAITSRLVFNAKEEALASTSFIFKDPAHPNLFGAYAKHLLTRQAEEELSTDLKRFGSIHGARFKIVACQISGLPCLVGLTLKRGPHRLKLTLYFYYHQCRIVSPEDNWN